MNGKQVRIERLGRVFRLVLLMAATWLGGMQAARAACTLTGSTPEALLLPPANILIAPNAPPGATLGSVRALALHDIPFDCTGPQNLREVRFVAPLQPLPDFDKVFPTNVPGIGMRVTVNGGSFAGIDDGPRVAPYSLALPAASRHLTGFALQVDFIRTGPTQGGVLDAGNLISVRVGDAAIVEVAVPAGAIVFTPSQCDVLHTSGMIAAGAGTGGAFTQETLAVSGGCNPNFAAVVQLDQPYRYGRAPIVPSHPVPASAAARTAARRAVVARRLGNDQNGIVDDGSAATSYGTLGGATNASQFGAGQTGFSQGGAVRR